MRRRCVTSRKGRKQSTENYFQGGIEMEIKIYLSNLKKYVEGNENGKWLPLPMDKESLQAAYNNIVGKDQEWIILDYDAPFEIGEFENVFKLNGFMEEINDSETDETTIKLVFTVADSKEDAMETLKTGSYAIVNVDEISEGWNTSLDRDELFGMVLEEAGYNALFSQPIPEEMFDYIDFSQIWTCLSVNNMWEPIDLNGTTYLVSLKY